MTVGERMSDKRVAVITGAAGGIGRATALELGRGGYALAICDVDAAAIERAATECGAALSRAVDVSQPAQLEAFAEACRERLGRVDVLVNNAGILRIGGWQDASEADWRRLFEVNLLSVALATKAFLPMLVAARGHVLNLGSGAALLPFPGYPAYGPVKVGVLWLSEYQRAELAPLGVRVSCVCPLLVRTAMGAAGNVGATRQPEWMFHTPEHVARVIHRAIGSRRFLVYASSLLHVLHVVYRLGAVAHARRLRRHGAEPGAGPGGGRHPAGLSGPAAREHPAAAALSDTRLACRVGGPALGRYQPLQLDAVSHGVNHGVLEHLLDGVVLAPAGLPCGRRHLPILEQGEVPSPGRQDLAHEDPALARDARRQARFSPYRQPSRAGSLTRGSRSGWPFTFIASASHSMVRPVRWAITPSRTTSVSGAA